MTKAQQFPARQMEYRPESREVMFAKYVEQQLCIIGDPPYLPGTVVEPFAGKGRFDALTLATQLGRLGVAVAVNEIRHLRLKFMAVFRHGVNKYRVYLHFEGQCCCDGCEVTDIAVMTIDHIDGDGAAFRRKYGRSSAANWRWVVKNNYPDGVDMKCFNCNCSKRDGNRCPRAGTAH